MTFGAPVSRQGLSAEKSAASIAEREQAMAERCMQSIALLAEQHQASKSC